MILKTAISVLFLIFYHGMCLQISAQHSVEPPMTGETSIELEQQRIISWLDKEVKPVLFRELWQDPKNQQELMVKNWFFDRETQQYKIDIVLHWTDRWSNSGMAVEGKMEFSFPLNGDAVFRTVGKTKNLIELEQIRETRIPGTLVLNEK